MKAHFGTQTMKKVFHLLSQLGKGLLQCAAIVTLTYIFCRAIPGDAVDVMGIEGGLTAEQADSLAKLLAAFFKDKSDFVIPVSELDTFSLEDLADRSASRESIYSFLVQAGYMTIKGLDGGRLRLGYPNREVADTIEARVLAS